MKYNFDEIIDRRGTDCLKYDFGMKRMGRNDLLPMWVADMDFKLPDEILADLHKRIDHGIFGYGDPLDDYFDAINHWFSTRYHYTIEPEWVTVAAGLVYGIHIAVQAYTKPGDAIMVMQPVYYPFSSAINNNDRKLVNCQLSYNDGSYFLDFDKMVSLIEEEAVKVLIFCSPHNPVGKVWTREELTRVADICLSHNVILLIDEIHCDFIFPGNSFTSCMNLDEKYQSKVVLFSSPGKTFNIAGFQSSNIIIPDAELRDKFTKANAQAGYSNANIMGMAALIACYNKGADWVDELVSYIYENVLFFKDFIEKNFEKAKFVMPQGTYLTWVDFSGYDISHEELERIIVEDARLWLDSGIIFGPETSMFERFNLACPKSVVEEALLRLKEAFVKNGL